MKAFWTTVFERPTTTPTHPGLRAGPRATDRLTVCEKILIAVAAETTRERPTVASEHLVVTAWEMFPEDFGLRGFIREHPDAARVLCKLSGEYGLVKTGLVTRVRRGDGEIKITELGKDFAQRLQRWASGGFVGEKPRRVNRPEVPPVPRA